MSLDDRIMNIGIDVPEKIRAVDPGEILPRVLAETKELRTLLSSFKKPLLVEIAGNIGFGKSTVARIIENQANMRGIYENTDDFLLRQYYTDMGKYSERLQTHLINKRFQSLVVAQSCQNNSIVSDRSPYEDPLVFSRVLRESDLMSQDSLDFLYWYFENHVDDLKEQYPDVKVVPDLLIHVHGDIETGWQRVSQRDRKMEMREDAKKGVGLTKEFYAVLQDKYEHSFISELRNRNWYTGPVLKLDQGQVDVSDANSAKGWLYIVMALRQSLELLKQNHK